MDENVKHWFKGFENAIAHMKQEERESLFGECGKNCADRWVLHQYKNLFDQVGGDLDLFYEATNGAEGVRGEIVEPGKRYRLIFEKCTCGLHHDGYIDSPFLCECSRQSILYVLSSLMPGRKFDVEIRSTILRGGEECRFSIAVSE